MSFWIRFISSAFAVWLGVVLSGCAPGQNQSDEEKEPHFVLGQGRVNSMDYQGAVEAFEESLEANPRSAAAHYQLAMLFDGKVSDPAAAVYHYQQYLQLDPNAGNADVIRQRIYACKQQLASDVMPLPSTPAAQAQLEKLADQNRQLQAQVDRLNEVIRQWNAYYASQQAAARTNPTPAPDNAAATQLQTPIQIQPTQPDQTATAQTGGATATRATSAAPRRHMVVAGETAVGIARKAGIKFSALVAANPGVNLSRIHTGQILNLSPP